MKSPSRRLVLSAICLSLVSLLVVVLFVPPPHLLLRQMVLRASPLLLEGSDADEWRITRVSKKLLRVYMNVSIAQYLAERVLERGGSDEEILGRMVAEVRAIILNPPRPEEIRHSATMWPALLSGVGYCDQVNAAVCRMAAHHFPKAELIALYTDEGRVSPHTIGRVWSNQRNEWLYFDAFYAAPVVFTRDESGQPHFLATDAGDVMPTRDAMPPTIYALPGWKLSEFPSTFGMYLLRRASDDAVAIGSGPAAPAASPEPGTTSTAFATSTSTAGVLAGKPPELVIPVDPWLAGGVGRRQPDVYDRVVRAYTAARVAHLFDHWDRNAYREVARQSRAAERDDRAAEIASAAARFASLPN